MEEILIQFGTQIMGMTKYMNFLQQIFQLLDMQILQQVAHVELEVMLTKYGIVKGLLIESMSCHQQILV